MASNELGGYVTDPDEFQDFFAGNGNLTHIPNDFFDYTIPNEPLAIIQVVGVIARQLMVGAILVELQKFFRVVGSSKLNDAIGVT